MKTKHLLLTALSAVVLALGIALAGIWYVIAQLPPLEPHRCQRGQDAGSPVSRMGRGLPTKAPMRAASVRTTSGWPSRSSAHLRRRPCWHLFTAAAPSLRHFCSIRHPHAWRWLAAIRLPERGAGMVLFLRRGIFSHGVGPLSGLRRRQRGADRHSPVTDSRSPPAGTDGRVCSALPAPAAGAGHRAAGRGMAYRSVGFHRGSLAGRDRAVALLSFARQRSPAGAGHSAGLEPFSESIRFWRDAVCPHLRHPLHLGPHDLRLPPVRPAI